jgi:hypothetical protein
MESSVELEGLGLRIGQVGPLPANEIFHAKAGKGSQELKPEAGT